MSYGKVKEMPRRSARWRKRYIVGTPTLDRAWQFWQLPPSFIVAEIDKMFAGEDSALAPFFRLVLPGKRETVPNWRKLRSAVFTRDNFTCAYCGKRGGRLECDHIQPVAKGGSHDLSNLTTACRVCNNAKGSKTVSEWKGAAWLASAP